MKPSLLFSDLASTSHVSQSEGLKGKHDKGKSTHSFAIIYGGIKVSVRTDTNITVLSPFAIFLYIGK